MCKLFNISYRLKVCVCIKSGGLTFTPTPMMPTPSHLLSSSICDRHSATFLRLDPLWHTEARMQQCGARAEGGILHCKQSPDRRLFGSFPFKATARQPLTHYPGSARPFTHAPTHTHTPLLSQRHSLGHSHSLSFTHCKWCLLRMWKCESFLCDLNWELTYRSLCADCYLMRVCDPV